MNLLRHTSVILLACILIGMKTSGQTWKWARQAGQCTGTSPLTEAGPTAIDPHGNIYVAGHFSGDCIYFGTDTMTNPMPGSWVPMFVAKYDSNGNYKWKVHASAGNYGYSSAIAADDSGNIYDAGVYFGSSITFGATTLYAAGSPSPYLVKYDSSGNVVWARTCGGGVAANYVTTSPDGSIYMTGSFYSPTFVAGSYSLTNFSTSSDIFVVKYDAGGNVLWAQRAGGFGAEIGADASCDAAGNLYICGKFQSGSLTFGSSTLVNADPTKNDYYLAKYTPAGVPVWGTAIKIGESGSGPGAELSVKASPTGNVYVTGGFFTDSIVIGSYHFHNYGSASFCDMYLASFDSSGNVRWAKHGGGPTGHDMGLHMTFDLADHLWLTAGSWSDSFRIDTAHFAIPSSPEHDASCIFEFDEAGNILYRTTLSAGGDDYLGIVSDGVGNIYIAGDFMGGPKYIGPDTISAMGSETFFLAKLGRVINIATLGVCETNANRVQLYPNPANTEVTVSLEGTATANGQIEVYNAVGQLVRRLSLMGDKTVVPVASLPGGVYLCRIFVDGNMVQKKMVVSH